MATAHLGWITADYPMTKWRINALRDSGAAVKFISMEPLVDSMLPLNLKGIDQVIVGGKSGSTDVKASIRADGACGGAT